ncbi:hypothetical protein [Lyngbya aestuarii]|uniref:hypothetical protein n=1 Tax=Lyngbya aestuarii TaxID=118322 RepID=UPI00403DE6F9
MFYQQYRQELESSLATLGNQAQNILIFYGTPGIGKTELCQWFYKSLQPEYL